jgi:hypothetical protein
MEKQKKRMEVIAQHCYEFIYDYSCDAALSQVRHPLCDGGVNLLRQIVVRAMASIGKVDPVSWVQLLHAVRPAVTTMIIKAGD